MAGPWMLVAAAAVQAVGAIQQGKAQKAQANAQATAARYNANLRTMEADIARSTAGRREEQMRRASRQVLGKQRAGIAQAGVGFTGSSLDLMDQSSFMAELDALNVRYEGNLRSHGLMAQAQQDLYSARAYEASGKNAMKQAYISAGASLLSGAAGYAGATASAGTAANYGLTTGATSTNLTTMGGGSGLTYGGSGMGFTSSGGTGLRW
jgi:hypothetical protein